MINDPNLKDLRQKLRNDMPAAEWRLWEHLRNRQLGMKFRRQTSIDSFVVDFYCPRYKLIIEVDGDSHFAKDAQERDHARDAHLYNLGYRVLRFTNDQVYDDIVDVLAAIASPPPLTPPRGGGDAK